MHHESLRALNLITKGEVGLAKAAIYFRTKASAPDQVQALRLLRNIGVESVLERLRGTCKAEIWDNIFRKKRVPQISNAQKATNWWLATFEVYSDIVSAHVKIRRTIEIHALKGEWECVGRLLKEHQEALGATFWSMMWSFIAAEETGGTRARHDLIEYYEKQSAKFPGLLANVFSLCADKSLPEEAFREAVDPLLPKTPPASDFFSLVFLEDCSNTWNTADLLHAAEFAPIVDRYEFFVRICAISSAGGHQNAGILERAAARLATLISDETITYVKDSMAEDKLFSLGNHDISLIEAWDAYVIGDYSKCYSITQRLAETHPQLLPVHELYVKSAMFLGLSDTLAGTSAVSLIRYHLRNVFAKNEHTEDSLSFLHRFGSRVRILTLTVPLRALREQHGAPTLDSKWSRRSSYHFGVHAPRNFEYGHSAKLAEQYLTRLRAAAPSSVAVSFFSDIAAGAVTSQAIPSVRVAFFAGLAAARRGSTEEATHQLELFLRLQFDDSKNPLSPFAIEEARRALVDLYRLRGAIKKMQSVVVDVYSDRPHSVRRLPLDRIFEAVQSSRDAASRELEYPIIIHICRDDPHEIALALKRFMRTRSARSPFDLLTIAELDVKTMSILYLRVCTPEVLDSLPALDSEEKVDQERISLLRWVSEHAPNLARLSETEILRLTQASQLRRAIDRLEGARVALNLSGLREAETDRFSGAYFRYSAQRELAGQLEGETLSTLFARIGGTSDYVLVKDSEVERLRQGWQSALTAFVTVFREVRDAFLYSPHFGLEACLSARIRHGFVVEHLRRPFVELKLAVKRDSLDYEGSRQYWRATLSKDSEQIESIMSFLSALTAKVDTIAEEVKNVWIQSRTELKNPSGLFDYSFSDLQMIEFSRQARELSSLDAFVDYVFNILLERTRTSLTEIQARVRGELTDRMSATLDELHGELNTLGDDPHLLTLRNAVVSCRSDVEKVCQKMARWFETSDATLMGDVDFDLAARTAVGMIEQLNPAFRKKHLIRVESPFRLRERHFTSFVHILFFLLDNAIRRSGLPPGQFESSVEIQATNNQCCISVKNKTPTPTAAKEAATRILENVDLLRVNLDPAKVIREGGSGFAKIIAAVRYEFKQKDPTIEAFSKENTLTVSIRFALAGLIA